MLRTHAGLQAIPLADLTVRPELCEMLADLERKQEKLRILDGSDGVGGGLRNTYYAVDFVEVPHMVGRRMVILQDGVAYVNHLQALDVLMDRFKGEVEKGLVDALRARPDVEAMEKDRVSAFLQKAVLESMQTGNKTKDHSVGIDIEDIVTYADRNMPLCMRSMDRALRSDRHLKFDGRFQYGLFLKHAGLTLDQAMKFFSQTMTLKVTTEKFAKSEFGYSVRHWYGKEGKKTSYNALNCSSLIMGAAPRAGQTHGCPFKHFTEAKLKATLKEPRPYGPVKAKQATLATRTVSLRDTAVDEILKSMRPPCASLFANCLAHTESSTGHHAAACREYFAQMHVGYAFILRRFHRDRRVLSATLPHTCIYTQIPQGIFSVHQPEPLPSNLVGVAEPCPRGRQRQASQRRTAHGADRRSHGHAVRHQRLPAPFPLPAPTTPPPPPLPRPALPPHTKAASLHLQWKGSYFVTLLLR